MQHQRQVSDNFWASQRSIFIRCHFLAIMIIISDGQHLSVSVSGLKRYVNSSVSPNHHTISLPVYRICCIILAQEAFELRQKLMCPMLGIGSRRWNVALQVYANNSRSAVRPCRCLPDQPVRPLDSQSHPLGP